MRRIIVRVLAVFAVLALMSAMVWAQATAQLSGTVRDQSGAVLPGAEITVTQIDTGVVRNAVTNETGTYVLPNLAVGPYRLEAGLPGFRTYVQNGIVLQVNSNVVVNPVLEVGQVSEQVEVQANAAMVETRSSTVGQVIENARILELPLNGRDVTELITLAGGAVQMGSRGILGTWISVGGGLGYGVEYNLDGASHLDYTSGTAMPMPFPDALQEFKVETNGVTAGRRNSSGVGAVTKAGTNEFHGDVFDFARNDLFNARSYFAATNSTLKRHQFGGTAGGPIVKNQLFFFAGSQATTLRQDPADTESFIPTAAMLAGDWTAFASPICNAGRQITLRAPFVGNRSDPALFSKAALNVVNRLPKPEDSCGRLRYGRRNVNGSVQTIAKVDYQRNSKHSVFGRYMATTNRNPSPFKFTPGNFLNAGTNGNTELAQSVTFGDTYLINSNMVQSLRLAFNRVAQFRLGQKYFSYCDVGVNIYCGYSPTFMSLNITSGFALGGTAAQGTNTNLNRYYVNGYQISDDLSVVRGAHQLSFGWNGQLGWSYSISYQNVAGAMTFNGQETGLGLGDFMLGKLTQLIQSAPNRHNGRQHYIATYASDAWKATRTLTVNYGVRWEPYLPEWAPQGQMYNFDYERFRQGVKSTVFQNAPVGFYYPGDPGYPGRSGQNRKWLQFAPRLGLAWDVSGDGRTSVRASYSYSYNFVSLDWRRDASSSSPWGNRTSVASPPGGFENPWLGYPGGNPFPIRLGSNVTFAPYGNYASVPYDIQTPTTSSWNLSVQRQVTPAWLLSASYIGSLTTHVWTQNAVNPAIYLPGGSCTLNGVTFNPCSSTSNTNQRRRLSIEKPQEGQLMGPVAVLDSGGNQSYNSMLLSVERRATRNTTVSANYTFSHCIGPYADLNSMGPAADETYTVPNNRDLDRGDCNFDRRQVLNVTAVAETPQFANRTLRMVGTGWRLSGIYRRSSGAPLNITAGSDRALTGTNVQRANQITGDPYLDKSGGPMTVWLNRSAFDVPALGTTGNLGRNSVVGPESWAFDIALSRIFRAGETQRVEFRAEAYNVTNSFRPGIPVTNITSSTFGQLRTSFDPRIMQFALKYVF